ncbi:unnamed protein product [Discula destructiva]
MAPLASPSQNRMVESLHQSAPVDCTVPYSTSTLRGKTILLTGGASGLGAAFARAWAAAGAHLIIGDIASDTGEALVAELRTASASAHHHFVRVDVTDWASQAALFQTAARLSPTGEIDAVVASAGVSDREGTITGKGFENPAGLDAPNPPAPDLKCIEVNLIGMLYTAHLALFWLQQNSKAPSASDTRDARDRHFLIIGSSAGLFALPGVPQYVTSKHGVTGLFRSLRTLSFRQGIRVNMLCPYFVDTPILPNRAVAMLAGLGLASLDDTVDAATRLMAAGSDLSSRIAGRALFVGPRTTLMRKILPEGEVTLGDDGEVLGDAEGRDVTGEVLVDADVDAGRGQGVWEVYGHDYETADYFLRRYVRVLNTIAAVKGWVGFWKGFVHALFFRTEKKK